MTTTYTNTPARIQADLEAIISEAGMAVEDFRLAEAVSFVQDIQAHEAQNFTRGELAGTLNFYSVSGMNVLDTYAF